MIKFFATKAFRAAALGGLLSLGAAAQANAFGYDDYIGSIELFGGSYCPRGTAEARGQLLDITSNQILYSVLGTAYGGDGRTTFGLPDLRDKVPMASTDQRYGKYCIVVEGVYPSRD